MRWCCCCLIWLTLSNLPAGGTVALAAEPQAALQTADSLFKAGKWEQARQAYTPLIDGLAGNTKSDALRNLGYCLERLNRSEEALPVLRAAAEVPGIDRRQIASALLRLGYSMRSAGQGEAAIGVLEQVADMEDAPADQRGEALLYAAWEHGTRKETESALTKFRRVATIPDVHQNLIATAQLSIGRTLQNAEQYEEAIAAYEVIDTLKVVAATNRARARIYRLECQALLEGDTPFHIRPYVSKAGTDTATVYWVSQGAAPGGVLELSDGTDRHTFQPESAPLKGTICQLHTAVLTGLTPRTRYQYTVKSGDRQESGSFRTAPVGAAPLRFSVIGDTQSYQPYLQPLLDDLGEENSDFVLHVGDVTDKGNLWGEWKGSFFDPGHPYLKKSVFWPAYGNHDGGPYFPALFGLGKKLYYSFDYGNVHVIALDSYGAGSGGTGRKAQREWLKQDLEQNTKQWTFVILHVPMVATRRSLKWFGEEDMLPLLEKHGVDIVFSGHHPHYRRYHPIGTEGGQGILHITSGGGGGPVGGAMPSPVLASGVDVNHFCTVDIDGGSLTLTARAINGAVIDRFELKKEGGRATGGPLDTPAVATSQARQVISLYQELLTDRTYELLLQATKVPVGGQAAELILDLDRLPRGPLQVKLLPEGAELVVESVDGSAWQVARQVLPLTVRRHTIKATAPTNLKAGGRGFRPGFQLRLQLKAGTRLFAPADVATSVLQPQ